MPFFAMPFCSLLKAEYLPRKARDKHWKRCVDKACVCRFDGDGFGGTTNESTSRNMPAEFNVNDTLLWCESKHALLEKPFLYYTTMIILPRQARDKHRKRCKKECGFLQGAGVQTDPRGLAADAAGPEEGRLLPEQRRAIHALRERQLTRYVRKRLFEPFIYKNDHFTKTRSGHT